MSQPDFEELLDVAFKAHRCSDDASEAFVRVLEKYREDFNRLQDYAVQLRQAQNRIKELESREVQDKPLVFVGVYRKSRLMEVFSSYMSSPSEFACQYKKHCVAKYGEEMTRMFIDALQSDEIKLELYCVEFQGASFGYGKATT